MSKVSIVDPHTGEFISIGNAYAKGGFVEVSGEVALVNGERPTQEMVDTLYAWYRDTYNVSGTWL